MVILLMRLEMLSQVFDTLAEEGNLHFRRTGVRFVQTILRYYVFFDVRVLWHLSVLSSNSRSFPARHYTRRPFAVNPRRPAAWDRGPAGRSLWISREISQMSRCRPALFGS